VIRLCEERAGVYDLQGLVLKAQLGEDKCHQTTTLISTDERRKKGMLIACLERLYFVRQRSGPWPVGEGGFMRKLFMVRVIVR
jgi:hypothetical protein